MTIGRTDFGRFSELNGTTGTVRTPYARCLRALEALGSHELGSRQEFLDRIVHDLQAPGQDGQGFEVNLLPRIIPADEWTRLEKGILQWARTFNAYIRDVYGSGSILTSGILPAEVVFEDPAWFPELKDWISTKQDPLIVGAIDLVRTDAGEWRVLGNRFSTPTGMGTLIKTRRMVAQAIPEAMAELPVQPVAAFAARLSEAMTEEIIPHSRNAPMIVLLSEGQHGHSFPEESFLARQMGLPLVEVNDLVIRDWRVHVKTIAGLFPVDVIYRRLESPLIDPVAFANEVPSGIPGLVQCARMGNIRIANDLGCGIADNRALLPFSKQMTRFYLGEDPLLQPVLSYHGFDADQVDYIGDHLSGLRLQTVAHPQHILRGFPAHRKLLEARNLKALFKRDPRLVVGQRIPGLAQLPYWADGAYLPEAASLRVFFCLGRTPYVLPGGLSRSWSGEPGGGADRGGYRLRDTWVLGTSHQRIGRRGRLEPELTIAEPPLPSRAAENNYWMGRYFERSRSATRMRMTLLGIRWDELNPRERALHLPLLQAISSVTEQPLIRHGHTADRARKFGNNLLFGMDNPASVESNMAAMLRNAYAIRAFITPELFESIQAACHVIASLAAQSKEREPNQQVLRTILNAADQIYGTAERTMLHDAGWRFFQIGIGLERADGNCQLIKALLPDLAKRQIKHLRDDTDLTSLLRIIGALDAYHRSFRSRAYLDRVIHLLWKNMECPASLRFCLRYMESAMAKLPHEVSQLGNSTISCDIAAFGSWMDDLDIAAIFPARTHEIDHGLTQRNINADHSIATADSCIEKMETFFNSLHQRLEDRFFSHHPRNL